MNNSITLAMQGRVRLLSNRNQKEVTDYITGLVTPLSSVQKNRLNKLVSDLKIGLSITNLSDAFDIFYVLSGETEESSLRNLAKRAHDCEKINSPVWAQFEGYTGNGTNAYLRTNYKAASNKVVFAQNSASQGVYVRKDVIESKAVAGAYKTGVIGTHIIPKTTSSLLNSSLNSIQDSAVGITILNPRGLWAISRLSSTAYSAYQNKALLYERTINSSPLEDIEEYILCWNSNGTAGSFCTQQVSLRFRGRGFTEAELFSINDAFETYMNSVQRSVVMPLPAMVFTFDDGYDNNYTIGKGIFDASGKKFTTYINTGGTYVTLPKMSDAQITEMINSGFDMQCHTNTHPHLPTLTEEQIIVEYDAVNTYFSSRGWVKPKHTAYPFYNTDASVKLTTAQKRLSGRKDGNTTFNETNVDWFELPSLSINISKNDSVTLASVKTKMNNLSATLNCMTVNGHHFYEDSDNEPSIGNSIQRSYMEELLAYADTKKISVITMSQLYDRLIQLKVTV